MLGQVVKLCDEEPYSNVTQGQQLGQLKLETLLLKVKHLDTGVLAEVAPHAKCDHVVADCPLQVHCLRIGKR